MGIGTTDPQAKLDIQGNAKVSGNIQATTVKAASFVDTSNNTVTIPSGAIILMTTIANRCSAIEPCPCGFTRDHTFDGFFVKASTTANTEVGGFFYSGGSAEHMHEFSGVTGEPDHRISRLAGAGETADPFHKHDFSGNTSIANNEPPFKTVLFCRKL